MFKKLQTSAIKIKQEKETNELKIYKDTTNLNQPYPMKTKQTGFCMTNCYIYDLKHDLM